MFISTLPPPKNTVQCQETSGQIFKCTFIVDKLSNGNKIVAITIYVPANFVFTSPTEIKVVEHETITKTTTKTKIVFVTPCLKTQKWNPLTHKCEDICPPVKPAQKNVNPIFPSGCPPPPPPPPCVVKKLCPIPPPTCDSKFYTGPCPPIDENAYTKCISAALLANDEKGQLACARLLPDTPENAYTKCISEALIKDDLRAELACAKLLPDHNHGNNATNTTTGSQPSNLTAAIQPSNTSIPASGGPGAGSTGSTCAAGNCTTGIPPPVDCTKNPNDPSCTQSLTPPPTPPTTKTCPDGSVIDASASCPTQSTPPPTNPSTPSTPPSTSGGTPPSNNPSPPPSNNPSPPSSSNNGGGGSSSGSGGSGSGSGGGSTPSQPNTLS